MSQQLLSVPDVSVVSLTNHLKTLKDDKIFQSIYESQPPMAYTPAQIHTCYTKLGTLEMDLIRAQSSLLEAGRNYRESIDLLPKILVSQQSGFFDDLIGQMSSGYSSVKGDLEQTFVTFEQQIIVIELKRNILLYALYLSGGSTAGASGLTRFEPSFRYVYEALQRRNQLNQQINIKFSSIPPPSSVLSTLSNVTASASTASTATTPSISSNKDDYRQCSLCSGFYKQCGFCGVTDKSLPTYNQCGFCRSKSDSSYKQCGFCPLAAAAEDKKKTYAQHSVAVPPHRDPQVQHMRYTDKKILKKA